jgi:hypothetical protein
MYKKQEIIQELILPRLRWPIRHQINLRYGIFQAIFKQKICVMV